MNDSGDARGDVKIMLCKSTQAHEHKKYREPREEAYT